MQQVIDKIKSENLQTTSVEETYEVKLNAGQKVVAEEKRNFTRVFPLVVVFDGDLIDTQTVSEEQDDGTIQDVIQEQVVHSGKIYMGQSREILIEDPEEAGKFIDFIPTDGSQSMLEQSIVEKLTAIFENQNLIIDDLQ